tara:strand:- start:3664 stop:4554 length:891 start_codon:yes stop_codon:yes gene_type:complete
MKSIMYHYVRDFNKQFPYSNVLHTEKFIKQIKKFLKIGLIANYEELLIPSKKIIPTFDDGFKDHIYTAELLKKYNSIGLYFIPTLPYKNNDILDVHKTQLITGKVKGKIALEELKKYLIKKKLNNFINKIEKKNFNYPYKEQKDDDSKKEFKKIMNYYGNINIKHKILNHLMNIFDINIKAKDFYLSKKEINYISSLGMIIGSHSESHTVLSRLNYKKQYNEIKNSKSLLEKILNKSVYTFCYPYGGKKSYNLNTLKILKKLKFKFAFSVEYRDIEKKDIAKKPLELPRYDCNQFN